MAEKTARSGIWLRRATAGDIAFIMQTERLDGYDKLVGRWDEARHRVEIDGGDCTYLIGLRGETPVGFAILRGWASPERVTLLKRFAVNAPGQGLGTAMLNAIADEIFTTTDTYRFWLGLFPENLRARRAYEKVGFIAEGIARGSAWFGGVHRDEQIMAMLRPEWQARAGR